MDLAKVAERRVGDSNAQVLANTGWAYAKAEQLDAKTEQAEAPLICGVGEGCGAVPGQLQGAGARQHGTLPQATSVEFFMNFLNIILGLRLVFFLLEVKTTSARISYWGPNINIYFVI